ncbi:MAG: beta-lactamase family protein [Myxococcales bacterium]|nr:beta-lactamase family protein [Myxococcales bacterium]
MLWWCWFACTGPSGPGATEGIDPELERALTDAVARGRLLAGAPAASVAVRLADGTEWASADGAETSDVFHIGSITKTFVATLVLQLADEGALGLDDLVSATVPAAPYADRITVRQLLAHSSGLPDYAGQPEILGSLADEHDPWELLDAIDGADLLFEPGTDHFYANTNYVILGLVVDAATGGRWEDLLTERLLGGLPATSVEGAPSVAGHNNGVDATGVFDPSIAGAAGRMVSDATGIERWGARLYDGDVLADDLLADMLTPTAGSLDEAEGYGLGAMVLEVGGDTFVGHSGSIIGFQSRLRYRRSDGTVVATLVNDFLAEADLIDAAVWDVLGTPLP